MNITLNIDLFSGLVMAKSHGSGVKFQLISHDLTAESVSNSAKEIHDLAAKIITIIEDFLPQPTAFCKENAVCFFCRDKTVSLITSR